MLFRTIHPFIYTTIMVIYSANIIMILLNIEYSTEDATVNKICQNLYPYGLSHERRQKTGVW